jgi:hypothetical protein
MNYKLAIVKGQVNYYMLISQIRKKSFPTSVIVPGHRSAALPNRAGLTKLGPTPNLVSGWFEHAEADSLTETRATL